MIAGFTAGSQSIAQASIVDISSHEHKARNLGIMLFVIALGFIVGPLAGGLLSDHHLSTYFNYETPFYFAAFISLLNALLLQFIYKETFLPVKTIKLKLHHAIYIFISAFTHEKVRELSLVLLIFIFGWAGFYSFISMFLLKIYQYNAMTIGCYMGLLGAGFGIGTGILVDPCVKYFKLKTCVVGGSALTALFTLLIITAPSPIFIWLYVAPTGAAAALAYSTLLTLFSNQVDETAQGWVMGITGAIMAFAFGLNGAVVGMLANINIYLPMVITTIGLLFSALLMKFLA
ncbi:MAG: MFS transporter [Legionellales bacterium]|nr:MFS transporter [Legionellales bacterium]